MLTINKKILVVATYPIAKPLHGGQKRVCAIIDNYRTQFSEVRFIGIFHKRLYEDFADSDIPVDDVLLDKQGYASDIILGGIIESKSKTRTILRDKIESFRPDIIEVEQPYLYKGIEQISKELNLDSKIVLSSHNIESKMKPEIYKDLDIETATRNKLTKAVNDLEVYATSSADLVIAVSESDAEFHRELGAKKCIVAKNGINKITPTTAAIMHWRKYKKDMKIEKIVTFVGSAHPPNWVGFDKTVGRDLSFLPPNSRLCLVGAISNFYQASEKSKRFWHHASPLGQLSDDNLAGLIQESDVILLPITGGGGSNLKTAEAILSTKKIVSTAYAFRGYEEFITLPNIYIANNLDEFKRLINKAILSKYVMPTDEQRQMSEKVQWQYSLKPLVGSSRKLVLNNIEIYRYEVAVFITRALNKIKRFLN